MNHTKKEISQEGYKSSLENIKKSGITTIYYECEEEGPSIYRVQQSMMMRPDDFKEKVGKLIHRYEKKKPMQRQFSGFSYESARKKNEYSPHREETYEEKRKWTVDEWMNWAELNVDKDDIQDFKRSIKSQFKEEIHEFETLVVSELDTFQKSIKEIETKSPSREGGHSEDPLTNILLSIYRQVAT